MRTFSLRRHGPLLLVLVALPALAAMTERYYFEAPHEHETALDADFELALGRVELGKAEPGYLFQAEVVLEDEGMVPELDIDRKPADAEAGGRTTHLSLGFDSEDGDHGLTVRAFKAPAENEWLLFLSDEVDLRLGFELGMADADLDFTGLRVEHLSVESGMATTRLAFDEPNPVVMDELEINAGMSRFYGKRLGNARFQTFTFEGGAGSFDLDFTGGLLPSGAQANLEVGMATLHVTLPDDAPVILYAPDSWLARVEIPDNYIKRGKGLWHSAHVRDEDDAFVVNIEAGMGKVTCVTARRAD